MSCGSPLGVPAAASNSVGTAFQQHPSPLECLKACGLVAQKPQQLKHMPKGINRKQAKPTSCQQEPVS